MAIKRKPKPAPETKLQMTSMIDVVFLLIIFFMVVTEMTKMEIEELALPRAKSGLDEKQDPPQRLIINLRPDPNNPNPRKRCHIIIKRREYDLKGLRDLLRKRVQLAERSRVAPDAPDTSELFVKIRADAATEWQYVFEVMAQCARVRIYRLSFAVWEAQGTQ